MKHAIVCWPTVTTNVAVDEARVIEGGETVYILEDEERREHGRLPVWVGEDKLFCSCKQFWEAAR